MDKPQLFQVELTNYCNKTCRMCPHKSMTRQHGDMDLTLFKDIVDESKRLKWPVNWLHHFGDPLLYTDLEPALKYAKKNGLGDFGISTNCLLLDDARATILLKYAKKVRLCVDSFDSKTYESLRGSRRGEVMANVLNFLKRVKCRDDFIVEIQLLKTEMGRIESVPPYLMRFKNKFKFFFKQAVAYPDADDLRSVKVSPLNCSKNLNDLCILYNGDLSNCCFDYDGVNVFGNFAHASLEKLWEKRKKFNELCRTCPKV